MSDQPCYSCQAKDGVIKISPADPVYRGNYWRIEHAYPSSLKGWLVIVLQRHSEALHELSPEEFDKLNKILKEFIPLLREATGCKKEYVLCFAEKEGFNHIHFHIVPRSSDLPPELVGPRVFSFLSVDRDKAVPESEVINFCNDLRAKITL